MLYKIYQKQVEAWKERYLDKNTPSGLNQKDFANFVDLVRDTFSSRHKDTIELLEAEIERKKGMREELINSPVRSEDYTRALNYKTMGYNQCLDEDIAYLEEQIKLIKNEQ